MAPQKRATPTQVINLIYIRAAIEANTGVKLSLEQVRQYLVEEGLISQRQAQTKAPIFNGYAEYFASDDFAIEDKPSERPTAQDLDYKSSWGNMSDAEADGGDNVWDISYVYEDNQISKAETELSAWLEHKLDEGLCITRLTGILEFAKLTMMVNAIDFDFEYEDDE